MYSLLDETTYIIHQTLDMLAFRHDPRTESILLGSSATETNLGQKLRQVGYSMESDKGAFGPYQMELATDNDIWTHYLTYHPILQARVQQILGCLSHKDALIGNMYYATAMARLQYARFAEPLPAADDLWGQGRYWCRYYNTYQGKGTISKYVANYKKYILHK